MVLLLLILQAALEDRVRAELERLASPDVEIRQAAEAALVELGEDVLPPLERLAATADAETRGRVADVVRRVRWWDHEVLWRGRWIDLRRGVHRPSPYGLHVRTAGPRIVDVGEAGARGVDFRSGRELWTRTAGLPKELWDVEAGDASVAVRSPEGVVCLDAATGAVLWTRKGTWPRLALAPGGDWIVGDGRRVERVGATSWAADGPNVCALAVAAGQVFVGGPTATTRVLDAATGRELRAIERAVQEAVDAGGGRVVALSGGELVALRSADGAALWRRAEVRDGSRMLVEGRRIYVADHLRMCCSIKLYALDVETGALLWTAPARGIPTSHSKYRHDARLARVGPHLVLLGAAAAGDYVEAFDPATGALVSRWAGASR
jgi:hypothetical protein